MTTHWNDKKSAPYSTHRYFRIILLCHPTVPFIYSHPLQGARWSLRASWHRRINYKLNVNNNYPALKTHNLANQTKSKVYDDLLESNWNLGCTLFQGLKSIWLLKALKVMYLREAQHKLGRNAAPFKHEHDSKSDIELVEPEIQSRSSPLSDSLETNEDLTKKAKIQLEHLERSFNLLIKNQASKRKSISYDQVDFNRKHLKFNKIIKAYVDVCCNTPGLVWFIGKRRTLMDTWCDLAPRWTRLTE